MFSIENLHNTNRVNTCLSETNFFDALNWCFKETKDNWDLNIYKEHSLVTFTKWVLKEAVDQFSLKSSIENTVLFNYISSVFYKDQVQCNFYFQSKDDALRFKLIYQHHKQGEN